MKNILLLGILVFVLFTYGCIGGSSKSDYIAGHPHTGENHADSTLSDSVPTICEYHTSTEGGQIDIKIWILGNMRKMISESNGLTTTMIIKDDKYYIDMSSMGESDCDWLEVDAETGSTEYPNTAELYSVEDLQTQLHAKCYPANFGTEIFNIDGKVCDQDSFYSEED